VTSSCFLHDNEGRIKLRERFVQFDALWSLLPPGYDRFVSDGSNFKFRLISV
jgi:hypothetical protein